MDIKEHPWPIAIALTFIMSVATALGTAASSYFFLSARIQEAKESAVVERKAKGAMVQCEKLQFSASLAAEIEFSADRGYPNAVHLSEIIRNGGKRPPPKVPDIMIREEQLAFEKRASELIPFLSEEEAKMLGNITLHHYVITQMRTSKVPVEQRYSTGKGGFNANEELNDIRGGMRALASSYRRKCVENI